jgi:chromosome segregation ATPase
MNTLRSALVVAFITSLSACAVMDARNEVRAGEGRVNQKQQDLADLQSTHATLLAQSEQLNKDLAQREMNASELRKRLAELTRLNEAARATTQPEIVKQQQRQQELETVTEQVQALEQNSGMSEQEKRVKLAALKERTRKLLHLLLVG